MTAISLGWGVQSWALAAMAARGEIEADVAIHADTRYERGRTYEFAKRWKPWLEQHGLEVVTVQRDEHDADMLTHGAGVFIPAWTTDLDGGAPGMLHRQCTDRWKIQPIRRWLQAHRAKRKVELLIGITLDEASRMKPSQVKYIVNRYPFILERNPAMMRGDVMAWLDREGLEIPPKSSCTFCPFHSSSAWQELASEGGPDWQQAQEVDEKVRAARPGFESFLSDRRVPVAEAAADDSEGQLDLFQNECEGYCGV